MPLTGDEVVEAIAAEGDALESVSDNEVAIAAIEAEAEVAIAEINADARVAEAEAYNNNVEREDPWTAINHLQSTVEVLTGEVAKLTAAMQPQVSLEEAVEIVENNLTPPSTPDPISATPMEAIEENAEESPALEIPPLVEVSGKPIIRLI